MWDKIKAWFKNSLTVLWARTVAFGGALIGLVEAVSADPAVNDAMHTALQPKFIPYYVIAIGLITELAHRRSVKKA